MIHAQKIFKECFHHMDMAYHSLALFLHPLCHQLTISQSVKDHSFEYMEATMSQITEQWCWLVDWALALQKDLKK